MKSLHVLVLCAMTAVLSLPLWAQPGGKKVIGGVSYGIGGAALFDLDNLNTHLANMGMKGFDEGVITMGGGGDFQYCRLIIGGSGHGYLGKSVTDGGFETEISGSFGMFHLGFVPFMGKTFRLYPLIGLGGGEIRLKRIEIVEEGPFDDLYAAPPMNAEFSVSSLLFDAGLGLDFMIVIGENNRGYGGFVLGVRAGYIFSLFTGDWYLMDETKLTGGPEAGLNGPYIRMVFGFGGFSK